MRTASSLFSQAVELAQSTHKALPAEQLRNDFAYTCTQSFADLSHLLPRVKPAGVQNVMINLRMLQTLSTEVQSRDLNLCHHHSSPVLALTSEGLFVIF